MTTPRFEDRPRNRRPGAGRPRNQPRAGEGPVDAEIVGAAAHLFAKQGVAATTMAEIAGAAGLGVSSIYYYFRNKHAVLERIVDDVNRVPLVLAAEARRCFDDPARQLHAFVRGDAAALCRFPFDINEIHRLAAEDAETFDRYWADRRGLITEVEAMVVAGIDQGRFVAVDPALAAATILANDEAVQNWYRPAPTVDHAGAGADADADADAGTGAGGRGPAGRDPATIGRFVSDLTIRGLLRDGSEAEAIAADTARSPFVD